MTIFNCDVSKKEKRIVVGATVLLQQADKVPMAAINNTPRMWWKKGAPFVLINPHGGKNIWREGTINGGDFFVFGT